MRIDGAGSPAILETLAGTVTEPRAATFVRLNHRGLLLDECIAIRYAAPHSFTGNDLVELTLHGSPFLVERVVSAAIACGARMAEPGEFTERAVLNGKMDLVQAESISDLINSRTVLQAKLSLGNLDGMLSRRAAGVRESLLHVISRLEAALDFSEEGYEFITRDAARLELTAAREALDMLSDTYRRGRATANGLSAVILGRPNAGKSTLLNRLVGSERAIVTAIPGTTRDILRETIEIGGLPVTIVDTAGLRESGDVVEQIGIARARDAASGADIIIYVVDAVEGLTLEDSGELAQLSKPIIIYSKIDLAPAPADALGISVHGDVGIRQLLSLLDSVVREEFAAPEGSLVSQRQRTAVLASRDAIASALRAIDAGLEEAIVLVDLYRAASAMASLTGGVGQDDVFTEIFTKFCIGK